jgi:hypothetical protein
LEASPWLLLNLAVTLGLSLSTAFQQTFDDSDYQLLKASHLEPMGLTWFPAGHILITIMLFGCGYEFFLRSTDARSSRALASGVTSASGIKRDATAKRFRKNRRYRS